MNDSATSRHSVAIIGAGLSGLTAAYCLHRRGMEVRVFESSPQPGGSVGTFRKDGYLCEAGPNTLMLADAEVEDFLKELGLLGSALTAGATAKKRFIVRGGKLLALPTGPGEFLTNPFLSLRDKWRVLGDLTAKPGANPDESIASFFERHFGPAVARELAGPFVSGVYAGNPESLVMRHAFPALWRADQAGGSVIRGLIAMKKNGGTRKVKRRLISWENGLGALTDHLATLLKDSLICGAGEVTVGKRTEHGFVIASSAGTVTADAVIVTSPVDKTRKILAPLLQHSGSTIPDIPYVPMVVVHLGFDRAQIAHPLDGFGVLIRRGLGFRTLGCLFSTSLFPGRAPEGKVLLTAFIGGRLDEAVVQEEDSSLVELVCAELGKLLQISGNYEFMNVVRWNRAIPQYERDYDEYREAARSLEKQFAGLHISGNSIGGISMPDCIKNNLRLGEKLFLDQAVPNP